MAALLGRYLGAGALGGPWGRPLLPPPASLASFALCTATLAPLHFCVVGSGPAGFYTVSQLLKKFGDGARVDIVERLPTPFGLVRSGVAPDHPETKNVENQFTLLGQDPRVGFFGNVRVGRDVTLPQLRSFYDAVILAHGAEANRILNVPGREASGLFSAREFVWWYNGHPDYRGLPVDLSKVKQVAVCGMGNVALDCARVLLQPLQRLEKTDVADHALSELRGSAVEAVHVIGRRGPAQAAFTAKELREVLGLEGIHVCIPAAEMEMTPADEAELKSSRGRKRVYDLLLKAADRPPVDGVARQLFLHFRRSPAAVLADEGGHVRGLSLERMELQGGEGEGRGQRAAEMVLESIGYRTLPLEGAPHDSRSGTVLNREGRVLTAQGGEPDPGLYVCGWAKRGPSGIIGTNLMDAEQTVAAIQADVGRLPQISAPLPGAEGLLASLALQNTRVVTFADWQRINAAEVERGKAEGRPRSKFVAVEDMLAQI